MTATLESGPAAPAASAASAIRARGRLRQVIGDSLVIVERHLRQIPRVPQILVFAIIQPIVFVLLFAYVFGGAIQVAGGYREYLMAGVFAQTMAFATAGAAIGMAEERQRGLIDRFRSLPMARSAVLVGNTLANLVRNALTLLVMVGCGLLVGWRIHGGLGPALLGFALLLGLAYAMIWVGVLIGLSVPSPEVAQSAGAVWLFPLTFLSNAFVPVESMSGWVRTVAEWNPFSVLVAACRELFGNAGAVAASAEAAWPMRHAVPVAAGWIVLLLVIFVPLSVRRYRSVDTH